MIAPLQTERYALGSRFRAFVEGRKPEHYRPKDRTSAGATAAPSFDEARSPAVPCLESGRQTPYGTKTRQLSQLLPTPPLASPTLLYGGAVRLHRRPSRRTVPRLPLGSRALPPPYSLGSLYPDRDTRQRNTALTPDGDAEVPTRAFQTVLHTINGADMLSEMAQLDPRMLDIVLGVLFRFEPWSRIGYGYRTPPAAGSRA